MDIEPCGDVESLVAFEASQKTPRARAEIERRVLADPGGTFLARDAAGAVVGAGSVLVHRDAGMGALAWVGGMMVDPSARRQGIARGILHAGVARAQGLGATRVALAASAMGRPLYLKEGFRDVAISSRWELRGPVSPPTPSRRFALYPISSCEIMELLRFDAPRFGAARGPILASLMGAFPERSFVAFERATGAIAGFCCTQERCVGPLVADEPEAASMLLHAAVVAGAPAKVITTGLDPRADAMLAGHGYAPDGATCTLMVKGEDLPGRRETIFGMGAWALG